jgi:hypothetical protein
VDSAQVASPYALAIDAARDTVVLRARRYKWLVMLVSLVGLVVVGAVIALRSLQPLLALALLPALVIGYFALDLRAVHRWRAGVLALWRDRALQIDILGRTLQQVPALPAGTVEGMLDCLPAFKGLAPPAIAAPLVQLQQRLGMLAEQALLVRAAAWALAGVGVVLALWLRQPLWLPAVPAALVLALGWSAVSRRRLQNSLSRPMLSGGARIDFVACREFLPMLSLHGVPSGHVHAWHRLLKSHPVAGGEPAACGFAS